MLELSLSQICVQQKISLSDNRNVLKQVLKTFLKCYIWFDSVILTKKATGNCKSLLEANMNDWIT